MVCLHHFSCPVLILCCYFPRMAHLRLCKDVMNLITDDDDWGNSDDYVGKSDNEVCLTHWISCGISFLQWVCHHSRWSRVGRWQVRIQQFLLVQLVQLSQECSPNWFFLCGTINTSIRYSFQQWICVSLVWKIRKQGTMHKATGRVV
jgi:hypothetical protein